MNLNEDREQEFEITLEVKIKGYGKRTQQRRLAQVVKKNLEVSLHREVIVCLKHPDGNVSLISLDQMLNDIHLKPMVSWEYIIEILAKTFNVEKKDILGGSRVKHLVEPRQLAYYIIYNLTDMSMPGVAKVFNRDHTTIMAGIHKISKRISENSEYAEKVSNLQLIAQADL